jgi:hypothetical protein
MNAIATKFQVGTAALAVAAAATLTPVAAQAAPEISVPTAPVTQVLDHLNLGPAVIPDFDPFYFGAAPSPTAPVPFVSLSIKIPLLSPLVLQPLFERIFGRPSTQLCVLGLGIKFGPYGTITKSIANGC